MAGSRSVVPLWWCIWTRRITCGGKPWAQEAEGEGIENIKHGCLVRTYEQRPSARGYLVFVRARSSSSTGSSPKRDACVTTVRITPSSGEQQRENKSPLPPSHARATQNECFSKYGSTIYDTFLECFSALPVCAVLSQEGQTER